MRKMGGMAHAGGCTLRWLISWTAISAPGGVPSTSRSSSATTTASEQAALARCPAASRDWHEAKSSLRRCAAATRSHAALVTLVSVSQCATTTALTSQPTADDDDGAAVGRGRVVMAKVVQGGCTSGRRRV